MSKNVSQRLKTHNRGQVRSTKSYVPWKVVHTETHTTQVDARKREKYLKSAAGRRWRKKYLGMYQPDRSFWRGSVGYPPERSVRYGRGALIEIV